MSLRICLDCTTAYAVGAPRCPHCGSERGEEQGSDPYRGDNMPKISKHAGATYAAAAVSEGPAAAADQHEGGEPSSDGTSSETSPERPETSQKTSAAGRRRPARTTASRSRKGETGSATAGSTAGSGPETQGSDDGE